MSGSMSGALDSCGAFSCGAVIFPGGQLDSLGSADAVALQQQLVAGLAISALLEGRQVLITDWLPGLSWRLEVSQELVDRLPELSVASIWRSIEPHLLGWLDKPADAEVFALSAEWGSCSLSPSAYLWAVERPAYTLRMRVEFRWAVLGPKVQVCRAIAERR